MSAYALLLLFGRAGIVTSALESLGVPVGSIYGTPGIVLVYVLTLYPYVLLPTVAGLKALDVSVEEASQNLGASRWRTFWSVTFPIVIPSILAGALLVFIETLENFGVPFVLAEDKPIMAVEAFKLFVGETTNPASAGVLGVLLVCSTALVVIVQRRYLGRRGFATGARRSPPLIEAGAGWRAIATAYCWAVVLDIAGAVLCSDRDLVHGIPRSGPASAFQSRELRRAFPAFDATAGKYIVAGYTRCVWRCDPRRSDRLCRNALSNAAHWNCSTLSPPCLSRLQAPYLASA